jgi:hypothetical protein
MTKSVRLADRGVLTMTDDVLTRFDHSGRALWSYSESQIFFDVAVIPVTGLVYATAGDNTLVILRLATGELLVRDSRDGRAAYGTVTPYGTDQCLVTDNFWGYRDNLNDPAIEDGVTCWKGTRKIWYRAIPADSKIVVKGKRVFAFVGKDRALLRIYPSKTGVHRRTTPN